MLYFRVFARRSSRSAAVPFLSRIPVPQLFFPKFHRLISFAHAHLLNVVPSYRYKRIGGWGFHFAITSPYSLSPFFPSHYALFCATAMPQLFHNQSVTHSFHRDGGGPHSLFSTPPHLLFWRKRNSLRDS